jgi:hypothetical protein
VEIPRGSALGLSSIEGLLLALSGLFERASITSAIGGKADIPPQRFNWCLFMSTRPSYLSEGPRTETWFPASGTHIYENVTDTLASGTNKGQLVQLRPFGSLRDITSAD